MMKPFEDAVAYPHYTAVFTFTAFRCLSRPFRCPFAALHRPFTALSLPVTGPAANPALQPGPAGPAHAACSTPFPALPRPFRCPSAAFQRPFHGPFAAFRCLPLTFPAHAVPAGTLPAPPCSSPLPWLPPLRSPDPRRSRRRPSAASALFSSLFAPQCRESSPLSSLHSVGNLLLSLRVRSLLRSLRFTVPGIESSQQVLALPVGGISGLVRPFHRPSTAIPHSPLTAIPLSIRCPLTAIPLSFRPFHCPFTVSFHCPLTALSRECIPLPFHLALSRPIRCHSAVLPMPFHCHSLLCHGPFTALSLPFHTHSTAFLHDKNGPNHLGLRFNALSHDKNGPTHLGVWTFFDSP